MTERVTRAGHSLRAWLEGQGFELALRLTLLDLMLVPVGKWHIRPFVLLLAASGLLSERVLRAPALWGALALLTAWRVIHDWPLSDNHAYLLSYWCLAICIALVARDPRRTLAQSARWMIALVFVFAVVWKGLLSPDFIDGRFFRVTFLTDDRFEGIALLSGMSEADLGTARELLERGLHEEPVGTPASLEPPILRRIALVTTYITLGIELLVAVLFVLPSRWGLRRLRDWSLIAFCAGTFALAPVAGFGWLLLAMGVAQCPAEARFTRWLYVGCFAVLVVYDNAPPLDLLPQLSTP